ncbi:unnamed protein product, partial [Mycena citricolor]
IDSQIPSTSLGVLDEDPVSGENITVPCPPTFDIPYRAERPPADITRISPWLDNLPMMTVQRIIHLIFPDTLSWEFRLETDFDVDGKLFRQFVWTKTLPEEETIPAEVSRKSLVVAFQPPWILSEQDIKDFAACRTVSRGSGADGSTDHPCSFPHSAWKETHFQPNLRSRENLGQDLGQLCSPKYPILHPHFLHALGIRGLLSRLDQCFCDWGDKI